MFPASLSMLQISGARYKIKTSETLKPMTVESTSHLRDFRAHRQAIINAARDTRKIKGLRGKKNGKSPSIGMALYATTESGGFDSLFGVTRASLKYCPPHQMPQTTTDVINKNTAIRFLIIRSKIYRQIVSPKAAPSGLFGKSNNCSDQTNPMTAARIKKLSRTTARAKAASVS